MDVRTHQCEHGKYTEIEAATESPFGLVVDDLDDIFDDPGDRAVAVDV